MEMGEYEDNYPEAYGRREPTEPEPRRRHFLGVSLPRQVRDAEPAVAGARRDAASVYVVNIDQPDAAPSDCQPQLARPVERPRPPLVQRAFTEIRDDVAEALAESPFIDASNVSIDVDGSEVALEGTINSLIAISLAKALATNVPGVGRVQVRLRVQAPPKTYEAAGTPLYKIEGE
jgi:hypothetical protein